MTRASPTEPGAAGSSKAIRLALGWVVGVVVGMVANYGLSRLFGEAYPIVPTTFVAIVSFAFLAMWATERLGPRSLPWIAVVAALTLAIAAVLFVGPWLTAR